MIIKAIAIFIYNLFIKSFGNYNSEYSIENNNKQINSNAAEGNLLTYEVFIRKWVISAAAIKSAIPPDPRKTK